MSKVVTRYWLSDGSGTTRRERQSCEYACYVPDLLVGRPFALDGDVAADIADAEAAIARLNAGTRALADTEALARLLLRAEAVASSRIEGLEIGPRRLLHADAARREHAPGRRDVTAEEVLGNIDAMHVALQAADPTQPLTVATVQEIHRCLLAGTPLAEHGGIVRTEQNWIGGSAYNPCAASFVPPPPELVPGLLADLADFCNSDALPAVVQAAIAHAQFETIHPFADGNGRTGRALIHLVLRRRGVAPRVVPPISLVLATRAADYVGGLTRFRYIGDLASAEAHEGLNAWLSTFAGACLRAVSDAEAFDRRIEEIEAGWRARLTAVRRNSALDLLLSRLPGMPVITASTAAQLLGRSFPAANAAVQALVAGGILKQVTIGRRNRAFEAPEVIDAFTNLERQLASPEGDTRVSPPTRPAPARRP